jgi:hypothetical protein
MKAEKLFKRKSDRLPFIFAELECRLTADVLIQLASIQSSEERELIEWRRRLAAGEERMIYQDHDWTEIALHDLDSWQIGDAKHSAVAVGQGVGLMLVFALLERVLRSIGEDLTSEHQLNKFLKAKRGRSKVDEHLNYLRHVCKLEFDLPDSFRQLRKRETKVRDMFSHGEWDSLYFIAKDGMAQKALSELGETFEELERAVVAATS